MLIAIDIGNTNIKVGEFTDNRLIRITKFEKVESAIDRISSIKTENAAISSVVPAKTKLISEEIKKANKKEPFLITKEIKTNLMIIYKSFETLGIDRLCSAEGAFYLYKKSEEYKNYNNKTFIISIDMGTATTINIIKYPREFIGGLISPGIEMMFEALPNQTAQLPKVEVKDFNSFIGNDTKSSIASGVISSAVGTVDRIINHLKKEHFAKEVFVYLTGGNAKKIIPYLNLDFIYEEGLVLYGINALWKLNKSSN
jgi:type III pantothenate kinase